MTKARVQLGLLAIWTFNVFLRWLPGSGARSVLMRLAGNEVGRAVGLHHSLRVTWPNGLVIGEDSTINFGCFLDLRGGLRIGQHVMIGHLSSIYTATHDLDSPDFAMIRNSVEIDDYAVLFPHCRVMPGARIGRGAVVLPGSVVNGVVEPFSIVGGVPAKHVRHRKQDLRYRHDYRYWFPNA